MKNITLMLVFIGMISLQSCTVNDQPANVVDNDTISEVFEFTTSFTSTNGFSVLYTLPHVIYSSDMVLVYRLSAIDNGADVWKLQPETYYFNDGTLDFGYDFDFTKYDVGVFMKGNNLATVPSGNRINQVFRVVVLPGYLSNKSAVNTNDYNAVVKAFNIDDSKVQVLNKK